MYSRTSLLWLPFFILFLCRATSLGFPGDQFDEAKAAFFHPLDIEEALNTIQKAQTTATNYTINPLVCPPRGYDRQETLSWGYKAFNPPGVKRLNNKPITICVLDSGFDGNHPDFKGLNITYEALTLDSPEMVNQPFKSFLEEKDMYQVRQLILDPTIGIGNRDWTGTGTATLGVIAAKRNKKGVRGIISGELRIHVVKGIAFSLYSQSQPLIYGTDLVGAFRRCEKVNPKIIVINAATYGSFNEREERYFTELYRKNVLVFAPAGNNCPVTKPCLTELFAYPASYSRVISVGSLSNGLKPLPSATRSRAVKFAGPAYQVLTTVPSSFSSYLANQPGVGSCVVLKSKPMGLNAIGTLAQGSLGGTFRAPVAACFTAKNKCQRVRKKICLALTGGGFSILRKAYMCQKGGALAAVIVPTSNQPGDLAGYVSNRIFRNSTVDIPIVLVYYTPGQLMYSYARNNSAIKVNLIATREKYRYASAGYLSSASVSAAAALVWRNHPLCTNTEIIDALEKTATDVGNPGVDDVSGYGLPNPASASSYLSRWRCAAYRK